MSNEMTVAGAEKPRHEMSIFQNVADPIAAIESLGKWIHKSGMFNTDNAEQANIVALACVTDKQNPLEVNRRHHLFNGRLSMKADAMLAEFRMRGGRYKILQRDNDGAKAEFTFEGQTVTFDLTWEEAQEQDYIKGKSGGLKDNWNSGRKRMQMMWARVVSDAVRTLAPEVNLGMYTPEEIQDFEPLSQPASVSQPDPAPTKPAGRKSRREELLAADAGNSINAPSMYAEASPTEATPNTDNAERRKELDSWAESATEQSAPADDVVDVEAEPVKTEVRQSGDVIPVNGSDGKLVGEIVTHNPQPGIYQATTPADPITESDPPADEPCSKEQLEAIKKVAGSHPLNLDNGTIAGISREVIGCHPRDLTSAQAVDLHGRFQAMWEDAMSRQKSGNAQSQSA